MKSGYHIIKVIPPQSGRSNEVYFVASLSDGFRYAKCTKVTVYYKQGSKYYSKALKLYQDNYPSYWLLSLLSLWIYLFKK